MTYLEAGRTILTQSRQPLHYAEITRRALDQGLIEPTGRTPDATMGSRLYTETRNCQIPPERFGVLIIELLLQMSLKLDVDLNSSPWYH
jgi:hypothetical protein